MEAFDPTIAAVWNFHII